MSAVFPSTMPLSEPIRVGGEFKRAPQWAAKLAPDEPGALVAWKNALLWLEGEAFGSEGELLEKVRRILDFQANDRGGPPPTEVEIEEPDPVDEPEPVIKPVSGPKPKDDGFKTVKSKSRRKDDEPKPRWSAQQLAAAIVQEALKTFDRTFQYTGPSLPISDVYARFDPQEFTYPTLIARVREVLTALPSPSSRFPVAHSARYNAATSPGKGKNFNIKVQRKDSLAPNGYSAVAQVHVLWS
jgi:hypothetical protein